MGLRVFLAAALMLLTSIAFAEHAISLDAEPAPAAPAKAVSPKPAATTADVNVSAPAKLDVYLVKTGTREVCDTYDFGGGDIRTECREEPLSARAKNPALRGICVTRYGNRTCY